MVCDIAIEARLYSRCMRNYPFVLGAQGLRVIDLAAFYAAVAGEGLRVTPYAIDLIEQDGKPVYRREPPDPHISPAATGWRRSSFAACSKAW